MNTSNEYEAPDLKRNSKPLLRSAFERTSQSFNLTQRRNKGILSLFLWLALSLFFIASTNNVYAQDTDGDGVLDSVDLDGDNDGILDAVECSGTISNVALTGTASQSSTGFGGVPSRAIDGNTNGNYRSGSVTHTARQLNPSWQVSLATQALISSVNVYNRTDCCRNRLANFVMEILNSGTVVFTYTHSGRYSWNFYVYTRK